MLQQAGKKWPWYGMELSITKSARVSMWSPRAKKKHSIIRTTPVKEEEWVRQPPTFEITEYQNRPAIWVKCNGLLTHYFLKQEEIWAVSGRDRNDIVKISSKIQVHSGT